MRKTAAEIRRRHEPERLPVPSVLPRVWNDQDRRRAAGDRVAGPLAEDRRAARARIAALTRLLDSAVAVPGTGIRFGLDPVLGIVPGLGDAVAAAVSAYLILEARRLGAPRRLLLRMAANVAIDTAVGAVPVAGTVFDVFYRANQRNLRLLDRWLVGENGDAGG